LFVHFDAPFRWTEPRTWPWFLYIWLAFILGGWLLPLWRWLQREQAKSWPTTTARIDSAYIGEPKRFLGLTLQSGRSRTYDAILAYSYTLSGPSFQGQYKQSFGSEKEAQDFLRDLEGQTVPVQYHPNKPARSVHLEATVETLLRNRPPLPDSGNAGWADSLPNWLKPLVGFFAFLSLIGLLLSIWVHVGALFGRRVAPEYFFFFLHAGIFVVFFPAILVAQKRVGSTNRKDFWKAVTKGSPDGLRYLLYFFFAYAFVNFFIFILQQPPGTAPKGQNPALEWRGFSGHWMVFYCASFVILSSALRSSRQRP
jgi:hypothetical protein